MPYFDRNRSERTPDIIQNVDYIMLIPTNYMYTGVEFQQRSDSNDILEYYLVRKEQHDYGGARPKTASSGQSGTEESAFLIETPQGKVTNNKLLEYFSNTIEHLITEGMGEGIEILRHVDDGSWPAAVACKINQRKERIHYDVFKDDNGEVQTHWIYENVEYILMSWVNIMSSGKTFWHNNVFRIGYAVEHQWPDDSQASWIQRQRVWPDEGAIEQITKMQCSLLMIPNSQSDQVNEALIWRLTFPKHQSYLSGLVHPKIKQCVSVVLALLQRHVVVHNEQLYDIIINTVFYFMESHTLSDIHKITRAEIIQYILEELINSVERNYFYCYFTKEKVMPPPIVNNDLPRTIEILYKLQEDLSMYLEQELLNAVTINIENLTEKPLFLWFSRI